MPSQGAPGAGILLGLILPYHVENGGYPLASGSNSTTAALFYGFKTEYQPLVNPGSCSLPAASSNSYAGSEGIWTDTNKPAPPRFYRVRSSN